MIVRRLNDLALILNNSKRAQNGVPIPTIPLCVLNQSWMFHVTIPVDLKDTINSIKENYGFNTISKFEIKRANERKKLMAEYEMKFKKTPL